MGVPHSDISIVANNADGAHGTGDRTLTDDEKAREAGEDAGKGASIGGVLGGARACWPASACSPFRGSAGWLRLAG